ncbi:MAG: amino acid permease, partial [Elusimicrobia bacterium]|nr:amino acid permease [Elusimicrobiota bacterium]
MPNPKSSVRVKEVVVLTTAVLTFISFWRAGAVVLCDLASTAYYIGGIAEQAIGPVAPWFILAVMLFSYCIRCLYMESCGMFVRGGVYRAVKESMGGFIAKVSVSALLFDYVLTGPISSVSAGQYCAGLLNNLFPVLKIGWKLNPDTFSVIFAVLVTLYFWRQNIKGVEESSEKSLRIIQLTTFMGLIMISWSFYTLYHRGVHWPSFRFRFSPESLGWLEGINLKSIGALGIIIAFGHALLGMSGWESLAQVYREIEAPKLKNLVRTGNLVFLFSFILTVSVSFFAVMIIPDHVRLGKYANNLLGGLAMWMEGPASIRYVFHIFVVLVGALILSGAVNTSIIGANGILNRVAEDGVLLDWFRKLHPQHGTTYRTINLVSALQILTIFLCRGDVYLLGEAYAFGVIWSFVLKSLAILVLRFKNTSLREYIFPLNFKIGEVNFPVGLLFTFFVLLSAGIINLLTKQVATIAGISFSMAFLILFTFSEQVNAAKVAASEGALEKLNSRREEELPKAFSTVTKSNRVLVAIRDPNSLYSLKHVLENLDSETTDVVVLHSKVARGFELEGEVNAMGPEERLLFSRVITLAEKYGHTVNPVLVLSNDPAYAIAQTAQAMGAQQIVMGKSDKLAPELQLERLAMTWGSLQ